MELRILDGDYQPQTVIDMYDSLIWTERYTKSGDFQLVASPSLRNIIYEDTLLGLPDSESDEVMLVENVLLEEGRLKFTGRTITEPVLNGRIFRKTGKHEDRYWNFTGRADEAITFVVRDMCQPGPWVAGYSAVGINVAEQVITDLQVDDPAMIGVAREFAVPYGQVYDVIQPIAETDQVGIKMFRYGGGLRFKTYHGNTLDNVVFSPDMDNLKGLTDLRSVASLKQIAYAFVPSNPDNLAYAVDGVTPIPPGVAISDEGYQVNSMFRRALMVFADDITTDQIGGDRTKLQNMLNQRARDALANNNYIKAVDGEIIPQDFDYISDYQLGDVVKLKSLWGTQADARITEYIRTMDNQGVYRAYPTVSVI